MGFVLKSLLAGGVALVALRVGITFLRSFGSPLPPPPPVGELRKVRLRYRCNQCGMELRVDAAAEEDPMAPRHCMDEMDLVAREDV
ncbi:MAG: hypothetical protein AB7H43_08310 [Acidimicrobiia bacterium]